MNREVQPARAYSAIDRILLRADAALRTVTPATSPAARPSPAADLPDPPITDPDRRHSAGLMRVNHTGEVCAQALYLGQALVARGKETEQFLKNAAAEEKDHLSWCAERLDELNSHTSRLNPAWYLASLVSAMAIASLSDKLSLSFVEETERQVCAHLDKHLSELSPEDIRSRAIMVAMRSDEEGHANAARAAGAPQMPEAVKRLMALQAKVMTTLAYWV